MVLSADRTLSFLPLSLLYIPQVMEIEIESYPDPWTHTMFRQEIFNECSYFHLMFLNEILAGYGGFWLIIDEMHLTRVTIAPALCGQGLAKILMEHLFDVARKHGATRALLEVRESNSRALRLYEGLGFVQDGRRKAYYQSTNEDAIVMTKCIGNPPVTSGGT